MKEIKKQVEFILHNYITMKREVQVLEFELKRITTSLHPEIIEGLILSHSDQEHVNGSYHSDKTAEIAVEHFDSQINGEYHALRTLISNMRSELYRLDFYLSLIPEKEAEVIRMFYIEGLTWTQITEKTLCAPRSMQRSKEQGLEQLIHYYTILDKLDAQKLDIRTKVRFVGYIHEERFMECLERIGENMRTGTEAALYIMAGCNELWQAGVDTLFDFEAGVIKSDAINDIPLSDNGAKLLKLADHFTLHFDKGNTVNVLRYYFPGLEYVHLELAIEAIKLALFPDIVCNTET